MAGTANLFISVCAAPGDGPVQLTDRHTAVDYARALKDLADRPIATSLQKDSH